jgi:YesN/AraC family two-component response regulator
MFYEKIMAIDDDERSLESLQIILGRQYELMCFNKGKDALGYLRKPNDVRLGFVDVVLKEEDGIDILGEIKKINRDIAVVVMTGFGSDEVILKALQNHADDFIEKPFHSATLREKTGNFIRQGAPAKDRKDQVVQRMKTFIERNINNVTLTDVANEICLSRKYLSRLFKQSHHCSFREFKTRLKIEKAKELLKSTGHSVGRVAEMLGYENPETFMRLFKRKTKFTPTEYRWKNK